MKFHQGEVSIESGLEDKSLAEVRPIRAWSQKSDKVTAKADYIVTETPVALVYNGVSHAVMMASPNDLVDFALGFSFTEGIISHVNQIYDLTLVETSQGIEIQMQLATRQFSQLQSKRRLLMGASGCGICGKEALSQIRQQKSTDSPPQTPTSLAIKYAVIQKAAKQINQHQPLQRLTGGSHGAAWCNAQGEIELVREDIGRHNALDKLIGACMRQGFSEEGFMLITSRASFEMVQKAANGNCQVLVALSAATGMAIDIAQEANMTLIGFAQESRHVVYCGEERISYQRKLFDRVYE